jgi:MFS family permease
MGTETKTRRAGWVYSTFPIALASGPLGTLVQLYLIDINGINLGTIYGSLAAAIFNGVSIPAALFWGFAIDRIHSRKWMITLSYALMGLVLVSFFFDTTTGGTIARYSAFSFVSVASASPLNLLIMETETKSRWAPTFAKLSMVSSVGNVLGLVISTLWSNLLPTHLTLLFIPLGVFGLVSAGLAVSLIPDSNIVFERENVALRKPSLFSRLLANPVFFTGIPRLSDFKRAFRGLRSGLTNYVPLFYVSTILFYFSSGLFNTSFVPSMQSVSISGQGVFEVILAGMVVQTLTFQGAGRYFSSRPLVSTSIQGLLLRGLSYVAMGASILFVTGPQFIGPALVFYPLASGIAFALYYTSANTMMFSTVQGRNPGAALGVYSAVVGIAAMAGSFISGFISVYVGFYTTFVLAGVLLLAAVGVVARIPGSSNIDAGAHQ